MLFAPPLARNQFISLLRRRQTLQTLQNPWTPSTHTDAMMKKVEVVKLLWLRERGSGRSNDRSAVRRIVPSAGSTKLTVATGDAPLR